MPANRARVVLAALFALASRVGAQAKTRSELLAALRSADPAARISAVQQLSRVPGGLSGPGAADALAAALEMNRNLVESTLRGSNDTLGIADVYGEDFAESTGEITAACVAHCDLRNPRVAVLLAESIDPEDPVARRLAKANGRALLSAFLSVANGDSIIERADALMWLANVAAFSGALTKQQTATLDTSLVRCVMQTCPDVVVFNAVRAVETIVRAKARLAPARRRAFHLAVVDATAHDDQATRIQAVETLATFRDTSDLALLDRLRETDTKAVANAAAKASAQIRLRGR